MIYILIIIAIQLGFVIFYLDDMAKNTSAMREEIDKIYRFIWENFIK